MITSQSNDTIKSIRKLLENKNRKSSGLFLAEGLRVVAQAISSNAAIEQVIVSPELLVSGFGQSLVKKAIARGVSVLEVSEIVIQSLSKKDTSQGIAAVIRQNWITLESISSSARGMWVGLQAVQNPGNLGTILRTCDAVGAKGVILLDNSTDPYEPTAVKASMGSIFTVPVCKSEINSFQTWVTDQKCLTVIGASDNADENCFTYIYPPSCLLLMGSERQGLPSEYLKLCHNVVRIPMEGSCDSLNLSVATGIILYQIYNQQYK